VVEVQHASDGFEHLYGGVAIPATLQPQVVVGADAGEHGNFLAPQSGHAPHASIRNSHLLGRDQLAPCSKVRAQWIRRLVHGTSVSGASANTGGPATPRSAEGSGWGV